MKNDFQNVKPSDLIPTLQREVLPLALKHVTGVSALTTEAIASSETTVKN